MPQLFDPKSQNWVEVAPESTREALSSGRMVLEPPAELRNRAPEDGLISVVSPSGKSYQIDPADTETALGSGLRLETEEERISRLREEQFGDSPISAGLAGAARGLTFGGSDAVARALGGPEARITLEGLREENPAASMVGEIGGAVVPTLLSGGASAAASGGSAVARGASAAVRGVGALPRGVARLGLGVEQIVSGSSATLGRRLLGKTAGSAAEGAIYGGGTLVSELALAEDPVLTADKVISTVGLGALVGGAAGGAFGLGEEVARAGIGAAGRKLEQVSAGIKEGGLLGSVSDAAKRRYAKAAASISEKSEDDIYRLLSDKNYRQAATSALDVREDAARQMAKALDGFEASSRPIEESAIGAMKKSRMRELVSTGNDRGPALGILDEMKAAVDEFRENPGIYGRWGMGKSKQLRKLIDDTEKVIGNSDDNADVFIALDTLKRKMGKFGEPGKFPDAEQVEAVTRFQTMYDRIRDHLEDTAVYGEAATAQKAINKRWTEYRANSKLFQRQFTKKTGQQGWSPVYRADPGSIRSYIDNMTGARGDLSTEAIEATLKNRQSLVDEIAKFYDVDPTMISSARKSGEEMSTLLANMRETVGAQNTLRSLSQSDGSSTLVGALGGSVIGGMPGAAIAAALFGAVSRPDRVIRMASALDDKIIPRLRDFTQRSDGRINKAISRLVSSSKKISRTAGAAGKITYKGSREASKSAATEAARSSKVQRVVAPASSKLLDLMVRDENQPKAKTLKDQVKALRGLDPQTMADRIQDRLGAAMDLEPAMAGAMIQRAMAATQFLQSKLPRNPHMGKGLVPQEWTPSPAELKTLERYVRAIDDPLSVVEDAADNKMTREGVEALRSVYPNLYNELVSKIHAEIETAKEPPPYSRRASLSLLLGQPFDNTFDPRYIASMQASYQAQPQPINGGGMGGGGQISLAANSQTEGQRLMEG